MILLDVNVLIALGSRDHEGHSAAVNFFCNLESQFATCPMTQTGFIRVVHPDVAVLLKES